MSPFAGPILSLMNLAANIGPEFFHHVGNRIPAHHRTPRLSGVGEDFGRLGKS